MKIFDATDVKALVRRADATKPLFSIPMTRLRSAGLLLYKDHGDEPVQVECRVTQTRFQPDSGTRVELVALDPAFGVETMELADLATHLNLGSATVLQ